MCSDPQQVTNPETGEVNTVACRFCDQCIAVRRHGWEARAMAEKAVWPHTLCLALTYNDETEENRDGAAMFHYSHVRAFLKRLSAAARDRHKREKRKGPMPRLKFIVAGEQGSRNGRCHWHAIIYSDFDIRTLGAISIKRTLQTAAGPVRKDVRLTDPREMLTVGKRVKRLDWSLWGHGFVTFQEPDQGGMHYVLSYCLKDQFTAERSERTARYASSENFATGLFRMSKRPAIGESWLVQKMERLLEANAVLPSLKITIPDFRGFWYPTGTARKRVLWHLKAVANLVMWRTGSLPPQWDGLLHTLADNPSDLEILCGKEEEQEETSFESRLDFRSREIAADQRAAEIRRQCGGAFPCEDCCHQLDDETLGRHGISRDQTEAVDRFVGLDGEALDRWPKGHKASCNPGCLQRHSKAVRRAFPASS